MIHNGTAFNYLFVCVGYSEVMRDSCGWDGGCRYIMVEVDKESLDDYGCRGVAGKW